MTQVDLNVPRTPDAVVVEDIRPLVASDARPVPLWALGLVAAIAATALFLVLDGGRRARTAPTTQVRVADGVAMPEALPSLVIPLEAVPPPPPPLPGSPILAQPQTVIVQPAALPLYAPAPAPIMAPARAASPAVSTSVAGVPISPQMVAPAQPAELPPRGRRASRSGVVVYDALAPVASRSAAPDGATAQTSADELTGAAVTRRGPNVVAQGTLIPAVLETALDSTRPGAVRALVTRDVVGTGGSNVLIPRGSRLFGSYEADLQPGQNRAFVQWTRLVRPDGVSIAIDSPAADALGRAGVPGQVDSHALQRFGSSVLQSSVNLGLALIGRNNPGSPVIVALPGAMAGATAGDGARQAYQPTLKVDAGVSVTVFVARDLTLPPVRIRR